MKLFFYLLAFIQLSFQLYSQNSAGPLQTGGASVTNNRWDLNKYVWSHAHHDPNASGKRLIDFDAIDNWLGLGEEISISPNGRYFAYTIENSQNAYKKLDTTVVQSTTGAWRQTMVEAQPGFFSADSKQYIYQQQSRLCFLQTGSSERRYVQNVAGYTLPHKAHNNWFAYQIKDSSATVVLCDLGSGKEKLFTRVSSYNFDQSIHWFACQLNNEAKELIIYELASGQELHFFSVKGHSFDASGKILLLKTEERTEYGKTLTALYYTNLWDGSKSIIWSSTDSNSRLINYSFDKTGKQVVFMTSRGAADNSIWYWKEGMDRGVMKVNNETAGVKAGLQIGHIASFTENGRYVQFVLQPTPDRHEADPDAAQVDIWSYRDTVLQPAQQMQLTQSKVYKAILNLTNGMVVQLEREYEKLVTWIPGDYAIVSKQCCGDRFWEKGYGKDSTWLVVLQNGTRRLLPIRGWAIGFSPDGRYLVYFDGERGCNYFSYNLSTDKITNISAGTSAFQFGHRDYYLRTTEKPNHFVGQNPFAAWIGNDGVLVYDDYDIWHLDIKGKIKPRNLTNGYGRAHHIKFELSGYGGPYSLLGSDTLLLKAFNRQTKYNGYFQKILGQPGNPELLYMGPCFVEKLTYINVLSGSMSPIKAADTNVWLVRRETATESPNYFLTHNFKTYKQLTWLAPQKAYNWYTTELHRFKQLDGTYSQGVLYKPENFDYAKKYPVIISFYTKLSDHLYQYAPPGYIHAPNLFDHPAWMVSHGYLVFVPDIYFSQGKWGPSTLNTMDGAAKYLKNLSYVDGKRLGAVGHSNSGRFGYYLLTHSKSFVAMSIGSGATDMLSSGLHINSAGSSMLQWAETGAVGTGLGNLWQNKASWLDQTAVLQADKVTSALLLFHCKNDGVPIGQAIEMFTSLRRLEKKCWWLQYDEGGHILGFLKDMRDFTIRYTQYFDHYLKGAPPPRWMTEGIAASLKAIEPKYELVSEGCCGKNCQVCQGQIKRGRRITD